MKSVFAKLALLQLLGGLFGIAILYFLMDSQLSQGMNESYMTHAQVVTQSLAKAVEAGLVGHDLTSVQSILDAMLSSPGVEWICVTAPDGQILAHTLVPDFPASIPISMLSGQREGALVKMPDSGKTVVVFSQPVLTGIVGEVHVAFARDKLTASIHKMEWFILAGIAGVMLFITLAFAALAHRIIRPIRTLTGSAALLSGEQRELFVPVPVISNDEIGLLSSAFNRMAAQLKSHEASLEAKVRARTEELVQANGSLAIEMGERERMESALRVANRNLSELIDASPVAITAYDLDGKVQSWNPAAERLFGWSAGEAIGHRVPFVQPDKQSEFDERRLRIIHSGDDLSATTVRRVKKDGSLLDLSISSAALRDPHGTVIGLISVITDVTEQERVAEEIQKARAAAEAANRSKSEFLANMSHEIRTPMNGVIGMTELALETDLTDQQREYLDMVKSSAEGLLTVINDILDFSKIEAGKLELEPVAFAIGDAVEEATGMMALRAWQKGLELAVDLQPGLPEVLLGDPLRLRQVLLNLLNNAIKFTDSGEITLRVEAAGEAPGGNCMHFSVRDSGVGIAPDRLNHIFDAFAQADSSTTRKYGGTGLGLTICSRLVALMGGRIWVESTPGSGSVFHFTAIFPTGDSKALPAAQSLHELEDM